MLLTTILGYVMSSKDQREGGLNPNPEALQHSQMGREEANITGVYSNYAVSGKALNSRLKRDYKVTLP